MLFIDVCELGDLVDWVEWVLINEEIVCIGDIFYVWCGLKLVVVKGIMYEDVLGFCKLVMLVEIKVIDYVFMLGWYVGMFVVEDDGELIDEKMVWLLKVLLEVFDELVWLERVVWE